MGEIHNPASVRLKVERSAFEARVRDLIFRSQNLHAYGVGPQPDANRAFRQHFLDWLAEIEGTLDWGLVGVDVSVGLQTPRLLAVVEDRVPNAELYRALEAEVRMKVSVLSLLIDSCRR